MHIRPELQALRGDDAPQRRVQARFNALLGEWRADPLVAAAQAELSSFANGAPLEDLPVLAALFAPHEDAAARFCGDLVGRFARALDDDPLGQVPLRHYTDDLATSLLLLRSGSASLALQALDGPGLARRPAAVSAAFAPTETWEIVLGGRAEIERVRLVAPRPGGAELAREPLLLEPGAVCHRLGSREALPVRRVEGTLVTLKLQRHTGAAGAVTCEYRLADGALLHQAAGSPRDSRLELTTALLGRMGRTDAAPLLAAMAEEQGSASLRWQALRECIGLDSGLGFATLSGIAVRPDDPLAAPAGALRAQLLETYPELAGVQPCPA